MKAEIKPIHDGLMELSMGPQHPSTHGVIRLILKLDGEIIQSARPDVGYLHRSIEKISEQAGYIGFMPYTDRVDYLSAMHANAGYAMAVEKLAEIEVPRKAEFLRVIVQEFNRIISHFIAAGTYAMDMGAYTPFVHFLRERESVNDLLESICGARLTYNYVWIGGVSHDLPEGFTERALEYLDHFDRVLGELNRLLSKNTIFINRLKGVGIIDRELAVNCGLVGPNLRASGIQSDIRRDEPYSVYNELEFDIPAGQGFAGFKGDSYDRFYCRMLEMEQSSRILRQALKMIPNEGEIRAKLPRVFKPRPGESVARVESSRGSMMYYILSDGTIRPVRVKIRTGSFHAMTVLEKLAPGMMISDFISLFASLDVDAPEIDR